MDRLIARAFGLSLALVVMLVPVAAHASWPMPRHDAKRSGATVGTSNLTTPVAFWRAYLGGTTGAGRLVTTDVDGDGKPDVVLVTGGRVVAKHLDDSAVWSTDTHGLNLFAGLGDLDGDGKIDIVAYSSDHVYVIASGTGAIEWTEPDGEMGTIGAVRVGDVTGDGKPDIEVVECGCCGINSGNPGFIWTFGNGFANAAHAGTLSIAICGSGLSTTLVDADGTPPLETLMGNASTLSLLGKDGSVLASTGTLGTNIAENVCTTANLDGMPGDEMICILNTPNAPTEREVAVLHYETQMSPPSLQVLWTKTLSPATGDMRWVDPVEDLDGDGTYELVISTVDSTGNWATRIFDALTGTEMADTSAGEIIAGTSTMQVKTKRLILTSNPNAATVTAWSFVRSPQPAVTQVLKVSNQIALTYARPDLIALQSITGAAVALDLTGSGLEDIVTEPSGGGGLTAYSGAGGNASVVGNLALATGVDPQYAWVLPGISGTVPQVGLASTDGVLSLLNGQLQMTPRPDAPMKPIALTVGGYYASGGWHELSNAARVLSLDGGKAEAVLVPDSRMALNRFDPAQASWAVPPTPTWSVTHTYGATIVPGLNGTQPAAACLALKEPVTSPPQYRVRLVAADGSIKWDVSMASSPLNDLVPGDYDGDGIPDFAIQWGTGTDPNLVTRAISGKDGTTLWETPPMNPGAGGIQTPGMAVGKYNGDTVDDLYFQGSPTRVLSGKNGSQLAQGGTYNAYSLPVLVDPMGSGSDDVLLTSGYWPVALYSPDLTTALWSSSDDDRPLPYPGIVSCGANPATTIMVQGSWANPARLKLTPLSGTSLGTFQTFVLAGGKEYPNEASARSAGAFLGQLTSANVHSNLTGAGRPTAVVGSSDGWLYGINPCNGGALDFAINLGASVGEAIFGDTDGDGEDEILVSVADGYLYDIKNQSIAKPAYVWDTDPPHGITNHDVQTIQTKDTLYATWAAVQGALGYEMTAVTKAGKPLPNPTWVDAGTATSGSIGGLPLQIGDQYFFAVRAIGPNGPSVDTMSDGVVVVGPDGGLGDGGAADGGGRDGGTLPDASLGDSGLGDSGGGNGETPGGQGGCGCRVDPVETSLNPIAMAAIGGLALACLRRRRLPRA